MKKTFVAFAAVAALSIVTNIAFASDIDKSGFTVLAGMNVSFDDVSQEYDQAVGFTVAGDWTFNNGIILGASFSPKFINDSIQDMTTSADMYTVYSGYQLDNGVRLKGGVSITASELSISKIGSADDSHINLLVGGGYEFDNNIVIDANLASTEVFARNGFTLQLLAGYKF
ncbi:MULTISPECIES: outer membrane beta-barrel protein [Vibrio]|uniref:Outer membrane protein beta-barrel domain-containing protein n=1 Tax=Vibrio harveyi TaxID=669 RepID=A0A8B3D949_VIBHA|nr:MULTISPECIES: outer membrane beta-barrel protein [Vibrio]EKO3839056.1 outer membrane beta-barrel protein [Vibrio harveyi]ELH7813041.1 outer membrane beta-barrel protein [Vibrio harveyi]RIW00860.1 hypothetical protein DS957_026845 [Vibrio harveyi]CAH1547239.1 putative OMP_b-brl domain-containing protein [Vibrio harveyi]GEA21757.1 hypothetical protein VH1807_contig00017-0015 [Vibrio harveyi]